MGVDEGDAMAGAPQIFRRPGAEHAGADDRDMGSGSGYGRIHGANVTAPPVPGRSERRRNYRGAAWTARRPPSISLSERLTESEADPAGLLRFERALARRSRRPSAAPAIRYRHS